MTLEEKKKIAHQPTDMFKSCKFGPSLTGDLSCTTFQTGAQTIFSPSQGLCYIFNFGPLGVAATKTAGRTYGLQLEIDIECKLILNNPKYFMVELNPMITKLDIIKQTILIEIIASGLIDQK